MKKLLLLSLLFFGAYACSDEESETPAKGEAVATIDGVAFKPEQTTSTNTGSGLEIKMKDSSVEIILRLEDDSAGTYTILNSLLGDRTQAQNANAECIKSGDVYYGTYGFIDLIDNGDGSVSGTFTFDASSLDGDKIEIAGTFSGIGVGSLASFGCLLKSITEEDDDATSLEYNSEGQLVRIIYKAGYGEQENCSTLSYVDGVLKSAIVVRYYDFTSSVNYLRFTITSSNNLITKIRSTNQHGDYYENVFSYDNQGKITQIDSFEMYFGQTYEYCDELIAYAGENVSKKSNEAGCKSGTTVRYISYDNKGNPARLITKALSNSNALTCFLFLDRDGLSKNNPIAQTSQSQTSTFSYVYNSKNYPKKITEAYDFGTSVSYLTYINCN